MAMGKRTVFVVGPTAAGKTELAIHLARVLNGEIISADSMQIYSELQIGTARPRESELMGMPHHLLGCIPPDGDYNVAMFQEQARSIISEILARGKLPIVSGGTGLYVNSLTYKIDFSEAGPDPALRERLSKEYDADPQKLHEKLLALDPSAAERIHVNDKKRLIRRLEILAGSGREEYDFRAREEGESSILIGLGKERERLYRDIEKRVDQMFEAGLEGEARRVYDRYGGGIPAFSAIGYKEFLPYFRGGATISEVREIIKRNTRRFAKRQLTWFRRDERIKWYFADAYENKEALFEAVAGFIKGVLE